MIILVSKSDVMAFKHLRLGPTLVFIVAVLEQAHNSVILKPLAGENQFAVQSKIITRIDRLPIRKKKTITSRSTSMVITRKLTWVLAVIGFDWSLQTTKILGLHQDTGTWTRPSSVSPE